MTKRMPKNWAPPYPAWEAEFGTDVTEVVMGYFGIQTKAGNGTTDEFVNWFKSAQEVDNGPAVVERARVTDRHGYLNEFLIAYWTNPEVYQAWAADPFSDWWNDPQRLKGDAGYWREVLRVPKPRFETLVSSENEVGVARVGNRLVSDIKAHAYWAACATASP